MRSTVQRKNAPLLALHHTVTTLADLDTLDEDEIMAGHLSAQRGELEPGGDHSRAFHHGWRTRMMDLRQIPTSPEQDALVRAWLNREREERRTAIRRRVTGIPVQEKGKNTNS